MGFYRDPYARYGMLVDQMISATGIAIDTGLHAKGWSRERAISFRDEHVRGTGRPYAVNRMSAWPAQIMSYSIGASVIRELRREAAAKLGEAFDLREFHEVVLRDGPVPLDLLQQRVRAHYSTR
jgi:uncharacterized protein (DUF885 family)